MHIVIFKIKALNFSQTMCSSFGNFTYHNLSKYVSLLKASPLKNWGCLGTIQTEYVFIIISIDYLND